MISDVLVALRDVVQADAGIDFARRMSEARLDSDVAGREKIHRDAAVDVLLGAGINPVLRSRTQRSESAEAAARIASAVAKLGLPGTNLAGPLVGEVVRFGLKSRPFVRAEFRLRRRLRPRSLWRVFEVPGLTAEL